MFLRVPIRYHPVPGRCPSPTRPRGVTPLTLFRFPSSPISPSGSTHLFTCLLSRFLSFQCLYTIDPHCLPTPTLFPVTPFLFFDSVFDSHVLFWFRSPRLFQPTPNVPLSFISDRLLFQLYRPPFDKNLPLRLQTTLVRSPVCQTANTGNTCRDRSTGSLGGDKTSCLRQEVTTGVHR